ncbi:MAG: hypothetical protein WDZ36_04395 [Balneolaceae bacterium]
MMGKKIFKGFFIFLVCFEKAIGQVFKRRVYRQENRDRALFLQHFIQPGILQGFMKDG